jgi:hypothetical protein
MVMATHSARRIRRAAAIAAMAAAAAAGIGCESAPKSDPEGGIAGVPIRVATFTPSTVYGNSATALELELDGAATAIQDVVITYSDPTALNSAPGGAQFVPGQRYHVLGINTKPNLTSASKDVTATVTSGGTTITSNVLRILPTIVRDGMIPAVPREAGGGARPEPVPPGMMDEQAGQQPGAIEPMGVPIRVAWVLNPIVGGLPTLLEIELDKAAKVDQRVMFEFDKPDALVNATTVSTIHAGTKFHFEPYLTKVTDAQETVIATVRTGGKEKHSDKLVINPLYRQDDSKDRMDAAERALAQLGVGPKGVPIRVSFIGESGEPIAFANPGSTVVLYLQLNEKADANRTIQVTFIEGALNIEDPPNAGNQIDVPVNLGHRGTSIHLKLKAGASGMIKVEARSSGHVSGYDRLYVTN